MCAVSPVTTRGAPGALVVFGCKASKSHLCVRVYLILTVKATSGWAFYYSHWKAHDCFMFCPHRPGLSGKLLSPLKAEEGGSSDPLPRRHSFAGILCKHEFCFLAGPAMCGSQAKVKGRWCPVFTNY